MNVGHVKSNRKIGIVAVVLAVAIAVCPLTAQEPVSPPTTGVLVPVPRPLDSRSVDRILSVLAPISVAAGRGDAAAVDRTTVVLHFVNQAEPVVAKTSFEDALKLARAIGSRDWQRLKFVAWIDDEVVGHDVLPVLAAESILVSQNGSIGDVSGTERLDDDTILLNYLAISKRRALFPDPVVRGLVDPGLEVAQVVLADGENQFLAGSELKDLRQSGRVVSETIWSRSDESLVLDANQLRELRAAMAIVESQNEVADRLGLATLNTPSADQSGEAIGTLLRITGPVGPQRVRRWQSNLIATTESGEINSC